MRPSSEDERIVRKLNAILIFRDAYIVYVSVFKKRCLYKAALR